MNASVDGLGLPSCKSRDVAASSTVDLLNIARLLHSPLMTHIGFTVVSTPITSFPCIAVSRSLFHLSFLIGTSNWVSELRYSVARSSPRSPERVRLFVGRLLAI